MLGSMLLNYILYILGLFIIIVGGGVVIVLVIIIICKAHLSLPLLGGVLNITRPSC